MLSFKGNRKSPRSEGLIVDLNERLFYYLEKISIFYILKVIISYIEKSCKIKTSHNFVDYWVLSNLFGSIILSYLFFNTIFNKVLLFIGFIYASLRTFEIIVYQINVSLFAVYRSRILKRTYKIKSPTRTVILLIHNYIEIIFWYAVMIISILKLSDHTILENYRFFIQSSFLCLTTFNRDLIASISSNYIILSEIALFEIISGLIMTIISLANFIGRLPNDNQED